MEKPLCGPEFKWYEVNQNPKEPNQNAQAQQYDEETETWQLALLIMECVLQDFGVEPDEGVAYMTIPNTTLQVR